MTHLILDGKQVEYSRKLTPHPSRLRDMILLGLTFYCIIPSNFCITFEALKKFDVSYVLQMRTYCYYFIFDDMQCFV